jgi:hypothetical protein
MLIPTIRYEPLAISPNKFRLLKKISEPLPETKLPYICN